MIQFKTGTNNNPRVAARAYGGAKEDNHLKERTSKEDLLTQGY
jgi:hypothetical protein